MKKLIHLFLILSAGCLAQTKDTVLFRSILTDWSDAMNTRDLDALHKLYSGRVIYYSREMDSEEAIREKKKSFGKFQSQAIISPVHYSLYGNGIIKCDFTKRVIYTDETKDYPAYILLKHFNDRYFIYGESDAITDALNNFHLDNGKRVPFSTKSEKRKLDYINYDQLKLIIGTIGFLILLLLGYHLLKKRYRN